MRTLGLETGGDNDLERHPRGSPLHPLRKRWNVTGAETGREGGSGREAEATERQQLGNGANGQRYLLRTLLALSLMGKLLLLPHLELLVPTKTGVLYRTQYIRCW